MKRLITGCLLAALLWSCKKNDHQNPPPSASLTITAFSPAEGDVAAEVIITGNGFSPDKSKNILTFNGTAATVIEASATQLKTRVPAGATTGKIKVLVNGKQAISATDFVVKTGGGQTTAFLISTVGGTAVFKGPAGVAIDAQGNLYVADAQDHKIRKISLQGVVSTYAGTGAQGSNNGNAQTEATFRQPSGLALDRQGNLYVADYFNHLIRKITPAGEVSTYAGKGTTGSADGQRLEATFNLPYGVAVDADGNVYVGDYGNNKIRKIKTNGEVITLAGNGTTASTNGNGVNAGIPKPGGLTVDSDGTLYVVEKGGGRIRKITVAGVVSTIGGYLSVTAEPTGIVVDPAKNVYVVYRGLQKIKKIDAGENETDFAGTGNSGNTDGELSQANFNVPEGLALWVTPNGKLVFYVGDTGNHVVRRIAQP
jgi:sugar lactone lactonase YvrE